VKAIEIDVLISADGVPFVFHDSSADRTTNGKGGCSTIKSFYGIGVKLVWVHARYTSLI